MKAFQFIMAYALVFLIMVSVLDVSGSVEAVGALEMGGYGVRTETDINETDEPLIFHGWVKYDGISVLPLKVYLSASVNLGVPVLTESEFVFHVPANETYKIYIYVENIEGNRSVGRLTITARWEQGATSGGGEAQGIYLVLDTCQEEQGDKEFGRGFQNNDVQATVILVLLSMLIVLYSSAKRRFNKL